MGDLLPHTSVPTLGLIRGEWRVEYCHCHIMSLLLPLFDVLQAMFLWESIHLHSHL